MRKASAIFLLFLFAFSNMAHYAVYLAQKLQLGHTVRSAVRAGIADRYLAVIESTSEIEWEEEGREFRYHDDFFDVVSVKKIGGKLFYYCLNDKKETELLAQLAANIKATTGSGHGKKTVPAFKLLLMEEPATFGATPIYEAPALSQRHHSHTSPLRINYLDVLIPPPWLHV